MNKIDELMALADRYATQRQHSHYRHEIDARQELRAALEAALTPVEPAAVFDEMLGRPVLVEGAPLLAHGQVLYTAAPPAQTPLEIRAPNGSGEATCIIRWMAETPNGWVGSFRREALEQFSAPAQTPPPLELNPGERYAGPVLDTDGTVKHHLVLLPNRPETDMDWQEAMDWANSVGGQLPDRQEQALLYANCKPHLKPGWHWSCQEHENAFGAWGCFFDSGLHGDALKSFEGSAVAVRRIQLPMEGGAA